MIEETPMQIVRDYFDQQAVKYFHDPGAATVLVPLASDAGPMHCFIRHIETAPALLLQFVTPLTIPRHRIVAVEDAIARINFSLLLGAFVLDIEGRMLLFNVGLPLVGSTLSGEQVGFLFGVGRCATHNWAAPLSDVVHRDAPTDGIMDLVTHGVPEGGGRHGPR